MVHMGRSAWAAGRVPEARLSTRSSQQSWHTKWPHAKVTTSGWPSEKRAGLLQSMHTGGEAGAGAGYGPNCTGGVACEWSEGSERGDETAPRPVSGWTTGRGEAGGWEEGRESASGGKAGSANGGCQRVCGGTWGACEDGRVREDWAPQGMHVGAASGEQINVEWEWDGHGVGVPPAAGWTWTWNAYGAMAAAGLPRERKSARAPSP